MNEHSVLGPTDQHSSMSRKQSHVAVPFSQSRAWRGGVLWYRGWWEPWQARGQWFMISLWWCNAGITLQLWLLTMPTMVGYQWWSICWPSMASPIIPYHLYFKPATRGVWILFCHQHWHNQKLAVEKYIILRDKSCNWKYEINYWTIAHLGHQKQKLDSKSCDFKLFFSPKHTTCPLTL